MLPLETAIIERRRWRGPTVEEALTERPAAGLWRDKWRISRRHTAQAGTETSFSWLRKQGRAAPRLAPLPPSGTPGRQHALPVRRGLEPELEDAFDFTFPEKGVQQEN